MSARRGAGLWVAVVFLVVFFALAYGFFAVFFRSTSEAAPKPGPEPVVAGRSPAEGQASGPPPPGRTLPPSLRESGGLAGRRPSAEPSLKEDPAAVARELEAKRRDFEAKMKAAGMVKDTTGEYVRPEVKRERDQVRERQRRAAEEGLVLHGGEWISRRERQIRIFTEWMAAEGRSRDPATGTWHRPGEKPEVEPPQLPPPPVQPPAISLDRLPAAVEVELGEVGWGESGKGLAVEGRTNLPDGFLLLVSLAPLLSPQTVLAWVRAPVQSGRFRAAFDTISPEVDRNGYLVATDWTAGLELPPERVAGPVAEVWIHGSPAEIRARVADEAKSLSDWIARIRALHAEYASRPDLQAWSPSPDWFDRLDQVDREVTALFTSRMGGFAAAYHPGSARALGEMPRRLRLAADIAAHPERENPLARHGTSDYVRTETLPADVSGLAGRLEADSHRIETLLAQWEKKD